MRGPSSGMGSMAGNMGGLSGVMITTTMIIIIIIINKLSFTLVPSSSSFFVHANPS